MQKKPLEYEARDIKSGKRKKISKVTSTGHVQNKTKKNGTDETHEIEEERTEEKKWMDPNWR